MKIGVLIPTYNRDIYFAHALESVVGQTYRDLEIIVIDNGSNDKVGTLVNKLNDPRVRYVQNEQNVGLIGSIRKGLQFFSDRVTWCTILPDDDLLDREFISSMVGYVDQHPDIDVVHGHRRMIDAADVLLGETSLPPEKETAVQYLVARSKFIRQTFLVGVFFSRSTYTQIGGYPQFATGMASDDALIFGLSLRQGLYFNKRGIVSVRMHSNAESLSSSNVQGHIQAFADFKNYVLNMSEKNNKFTSFDLKMIRRAINRYVRASISSIWLRRVHALLFDGLPSPDRELSELYKMVAENDASFSLRVRIAAFCGNTLHWNLESDHWYRYLNELRLRLTRRNRRS
jgi:glycosyltransferase involved in cell wall biosynthesis